MLDDKNDEFVPDPVISDAKDETIEALSQPDTFTASPSKDAIKASVPKKTPRRAKLSAEKKKKVISKNKSRSGGRTGKNSASVKYLIIRRENFNVEVHIKTDKKVLPGQQTMRHKMILEHAKKLA